MYKPFMLCLIWLLTLLVTLGCQRGPKRYAIEGTITLNGSPLESGSINFRPEPGTSGPTAGAEIAGGKFFVPAKVGLLPGRYRVEITASRPGKNVVLDELSGREVLAYEQYLPARYNIRTELYAEVSTSSANQFEFALDL